jgi:signal recognition particle receptor subunit beta
MVWFDRRHQKLVVRIVYDGPAFAGKTTNLRQLCMSFTRQRRSDLACPEEIGGRTQVFDWMSLDAGIVSGFGLRCHMVSVPGQARLARRRFALLDTADVIVFVCESTVRGVEAGQTVLELLRARICDRSRPPIIVLQANKQDHPEALAASVVASSLELPPGVAVIPARAGDGVGVRETAVLAIRAAADVAQSEVLTHGIDGLRDDPDDSSSLYEQLRVLVPAPARPSARRPTAGGRPVPPESEVAPQPPIIEIGQVEGQSERTDSEDERPPLPFGEVASGHIWPAVKGREVLRAVDASRAAGLVAWDFGGAPNAYSVIVGEHQLVTSADRRFDDIDHARAALLAAARDYMKGATTPPVDAPTLCIVPDERATWLWSIAARSDPLDAGLSSVPRTGEGASRP